MCLQLDPYYLAPLWPDSIALAALLYHEAHHPEPLIVVWDNGPAHRGEAIRDYLAAPEVHLLSNGRYHVAVTAAGRSGGTAAQNRLHRPRPGASSGESMQWPAGCPPRP